MASILVIDDDDAVLRSVTRILTGDGHEVVAYEHAGDALRRFAGDPTDLVITDIFMEGFDGFELLTRLRETFPDTPVITMSGGGVLAAKPVLSASSLMGAAAALQKPFEVDELRTCVARVLAESRAD